jgi:Protein of unknown function (DUF2917)
MTTFQPLTAHAVLAVPALLHRRQPAGSWQLGRGQAVYLRGKEAAVLRINAGRVWATLDGPHSGPANDLGDRVLAAGEQLTVPAGQGVVIEPWGRATPDSAFFSWDPLPAVQLESAPASAGSTVHSAAHSAVHSAARSRLQVAVGEPLRELGLALWLVAQALGHLARGVAGLGEFLVAGRGRVLPRMESNPP